MTTRLTTICASILLLVPASYASADDAAERAAMAQLRLTTEASLMTGCARVGGSVRDDSLKDLRRKILKAGGNAAVLSFSPNNLDRIQAEVFRCPVAGGSAPVPPPPPGSPPPPPRSGSPGPPPPPPIR